MTAETIIDPRLASYIEYDGYVFNQNCKLKISLAPNEDPAKRITESKTYKIQVNGYITPRPNIGQDVSIPPLDLSLKAASQLQIPTRTNNDNPQNGPDNRYAVNATTDNEMKLLLCRLSEAGKTLRVFGQGFGALYVNCINPATGIYVPDITHGPKPRVVSCELIGFKKAWYISWQCDVTIMSCCDHDVSFNDPNNRIRSFIYSVASSINSSGYDTRTIKGSLNIISPIYRGSKNAPYGRTEISNTLPADLQRNSVVPHVNPPPPAGGRLDITKPFESSKRTGATKITRGPEFPEADGPLPNNPLPRSAGDNNIGRYLYETIDQWKEYITNKICVPFGYRRDQQEFEESPDKTVINFTIVDKETPPFGLAAKYSKIKGSHRTQAKNRVNFFKFESTLEMTFMFPKFINSPMYLQPNQTNKVRTLQANGISVFGRGDKPIPLGFGYVTEAFKRIPNKIEAYLDFIRIVYQRFAMSLLRARNPNSNNSGIMNFIRNLLPFLVGGGIVANELEAEERRDLDNSIRSATGVSKRNGNPGIFYPISWQVNESIPDLEITFTMGYAIVSDLYNIFACTGHGLPLIICSDLDADRTLLEAQQIANVGSRAARNRQNFNRQSAYIASMLTSRYTDIIAHERWLNSMRYSVINPRGSGNLYEDPSSDYISNVCSNNNPLKCLKSSTETANTVAEPLIPLVPEILGLPNLRTLPRPVTGGNTIGSINSNSSTQVPVFNNTSGGIRPQELNDNYGGAAGMGNVELPKNNSDPSNADRDHGEINRNGVAGTDDFYGQGDYAYITSGGTIGSTPYMAGASPYGSYAKVTTRNLYASGLDLFIVENLGTTIPGIYRKENRSDLTVSQYDVFSDNLKDNTDVLNFAGFFDSSSSLVNNFIVEAIGFLAPECSWIEYTSDITTDTDNNLVVHVLQPKKDLSPTSIPEGTNTHVETNFDRITNIGPGGILGELQENAYQFEHPPYDHVIQYLGAPVTRIFLRGKAMRVGYEVVPPTLLRYGGKRAFQVRRRFSQRIVGQSIAPIYYGEWDIEYIVRNTPVGLLPVPDNPLNKLEIDNQVQEDNNGFVFNYFDKENQVVDLFVPNASTPSTTTPNALLDGIVNPE